MLFSYPIRSKKPIKTCLTLIVRTWESATHIWFMVLLVFVVSGQSDYFGFSCPFPVNQVGKLITETTLERLEHYGWMPIAYLLARSNIQGKTARHSVKNCSIYSGANLSSDVQGQITRAVVR